MFTRNLIARRPYNSSPYILDADIKNCRRCHQMGAARRLTTARTATAAAKGSPSYASARLAPLDTLLPPYRQYTVAPSFLQYYGYSMLWVRGSERVSYKKVDGTCMSY